jgi:pimeloyl-ACP methyl ester carboxylesterase
MFVWFRKAAGSSSSAVRISPIHFRHTKPNDCQMTSVLKRIGYTAVSRPPSRRRRSCLGRPDPAHSNRWSPFGKRHIVVTREHAEQLAYFSEPAAGDRPTLLFLHSFLSTSYDWYRRMTFLYARSFCVIAPTMLGGAKPAQTGAYKPILVTRDLVTPLDAVGVPHVVLVQHDWFV